MRFVYLIIGAALLFATLLSSRAYSNASANMTAAINSTSQYIESVNESAYLVFYPNLANAYNVLNASVNASRTNTTKAYALLHLARASAAAAQHQIDQYYSVSLYTLAISSVILAAMLYRLMRKPRSKRNHNI